MNANSLSRIPTINSWLKNASDKLAEVGITSARLDAEIMLSHILAKNRTYLHAHSDRILSNSELKSLNSMLNCRLKRIPLAYLTGYKEFFGREFIVNSDVLIPRPESEDIINLLLKIKPAGQLIDVGTGCGILGITAKLEFPRLYVILIDNDASALKIAKTNAENLDAKVTLIKNDLLTDLMFNPRFIVANLPYVDTSWERSPETQHEPPKALFAADSGLAIIKQLIHQASNVLPSSGYLVLEGDPSQHDTIIEYASSFGLVKYKIEGYAVALTKGVNTNAVKAYQQNAYNCNAEN